MAKIRVTPIFITTCLFGDEYIRITGAGWDPVNETVIFDIEGTNVPKTEGEVTSIIHETRRSVEFREVPQPKDRRDG